MGNAVQRPDEGVLYEKRRPENEALFSKRESVLQMVENDLIIAPGEKSYSVIC